MKVLRRSKTIEILFTLSKGPKHIRKLQSEVGGSASTVEVCVEELLKEGLIHERKLESWPFRRELELTEKGKEIVRVTELQGGVLGLVTSPSKDRAEWILALLHAVGGKIEGRLRLQKLMFLLKHEQKIDVPYKFVPYMYGPYSADVFEDLPLLRDDGFIEVLEKGVASQEIVGTPTMDFSLTAKGEEKAREIFLKKLSPKIRQALLELDHFNKLDLRELIKYVYDNYPRESLGIQVS